MDTILLTNDDGCDSRALVPFAKAMASLGDVRVVVPDRERSWVGKAISRFEELRVATIENGEVDITTVSGFPADCVQLGVFNLGEAPDLVVSGINIGANHGQAFVMGSGTVGASIEAAIVGVPAMAFSAVSVGEWSEWSAWARTPASDEMWQRLASVALDVASVVLDAGFPPEVDVFKVEMPAEATLHTPRRVSPAAPIRYRSLFEHKAGDIYHHRYYGGLHPVGPMEDTDWTVAQQGRIAITPLHIDMSAPVSIDLRSRLERS